MAQVLGHVAIRIVDHTRRDLDDMIVVALLGDGGSVDSPPTCCPDAKVLATPSSNGAASTWLALVTHNDMS